MQVLNSTDETSMLAFEYVEIVLDAQLHGRFSRGNQI